MPACAAGMAPPALGAYMSSLDLLLADVMWPSGHLSVKQERYGKRDEKPLLKLTYFSNPAYSYMKNLPRET